MRYSAGLNVVDEDSAELKETAHTNARLACSDLFAQLKRSAKPERIRRTGGDRRGPEGRDPSWLPRARRPHKRRKHR